MSYAVSAALQAAVYQSLTSDAVLVGQVGDAIFDAMPAGEVPPIYVTLGPEKVRDASDATGRGAVHVFVVSVVTSEAGFQMAKTVSATICDRLIDADLVLTRGTLINLSFDSAKARRTENADLRQIDLTFRARVADE